MELIDSGAQVFSVNSQFCEELALVIQPLGQLLELKETGGTAIPYLGFMEVNLQIPGIQCYNEDVLLLVILTMTYSQIVPVMVGSKITDKALSVMTKGELEKAATTWRQAHFGAVMSRSLQLSHTNTSKTGMEEEVSHSSPGCDPVEVWKFSLDDIKGPVCITQKVTILLFSTASVHVNTTVKGHCMLVHVLMELRLGPQLPAAVVLTATYGKIASWVLKDMYLPVQLVLLTVVGQAVPANQVPVVVHPPRTTKSHITNYKRDGSWEALDLQGLNKWPESEQR